MNLKNTNVLLISAFFLLLTVNVNAGDKVDNQQLEQARVLVKTFATDLKKVLSKSMISGGAINALKQCNIQAPLIADKHTALSGWRVGRTALKVRNEDNTPDDWEINVLKQFEQRKLAGENLTTMEYAETVVKGNQRIYRYMKPIPTAGLCLTCHGAELTESVSEKVQSLYPKDQATGFSLGDIRGAFTLEKVQTH